MIRSELVQLLVQDNPGLRSVRSRRSCRSSSTRSSARLQEDGRVELRGFGAFSTRARDARTGRNPRTGETVEVDAKRVPYLQAWRNAHRSTSELARLQAHRFSTNA